MLYLYSIRYFQSDSLQAIRRFVPSKRHGAKISNNFESNKKNVDYLKFYDLGSRWVVAIKNEGSQDGLLGRRKYHLPSEQYSRSPSTSGNAVTSPFFTKPSNTFLEDTILKT